MHAGMVAAGMAYVIMFRVVQSYVPAIASLARAEITIARSQHREIRQSPGKRATAAIAMCRPMSALLCSTMLKSALLP